MEDTQIEKLFSEIAHWSGYPQQSFRTYTSHIQSVSDARIAKFLFQVSDNSDGRQRNAISIQRMDKTWTAVSDKWPNLVFDLKKTLLGILPGLSIGTLGLISGSNPESNVIVLLSALAIWAYLNESRKIHLTTQHATVLAHVANYSYLGQPFAKTHLMALHYVFEYNGWDFDRTLKELESLGIVILSKDHSRLTLRERILTLPSTIELSSSLENNEHVKTLSVLFIAADPTDV